ncbi:nitroreductase family protein [Ancylobacter oerskovii]|uniref:Putative NAD(P)H nitroreductase n=1 Tax=Ancylobacter oerskovii TaxID=459519 RepID=A0ABW4Z3I2_9HYPH|nr:nitroreductase [Ancylobacter oerskovii]MBS7546127.1 nitroreductase [Ancylobacter oerskovii]
MAHEHASAELVRDPDFAPPPALEPMIERLAGRRSAPLRSLGGPAPTPEELDRLFELALRVPDHGRLTPWRFIVIEGEARAVLGSRLDALYARQNPELPPSKVDMWTLYLMRAPLTVVLVSRPDPAAKVPEWNQELSAGAAGMALTVAASALGLATQWLLKWPGRDPQAAALLGLGAGEKVAGFIHIGRPTVASPDRPRPDAAAVVTRWRPAD